MVSEPITSWDVLWDAQYENNILMQDSVRDAFMVALKRNGYSMNSLNEAELEQAKNDLIALAIFSCRKHENANGRNKATCFFLPPV